MRKKLLCGLLLLFLALPFLGRILGSEALAADGDTGVVNPQYTFKSVDGVSVSTKTEQGEVTLLLFGRTTCTKTQKTVNEIAKSTWVGSSNLRVIFAECDMADAEETRTFGRNYGCDNITFCYDEADGISKALFSYNGPGSVTLPVTVLIDGTNRVRSILTNTQTADTIKTKIEEFAMLEDGMPGTGVGDGSGNANPAYTLNAIDGTSVSTTANAGQVSVILFGKTTCGYTRGTVREIAQSAWVGNSDVRVVFAEFNGTTLEEMKTFASDYGQEKMIFCYDDQDPYGNIYKAMWSYLRIAGLNGGTYPYTVFIDGSDQVKEVLTGPQTAEDIKAKIDAYAQKPGDGDAKPGDGDTKPGDGNTKPGDGDTKPGDGNTKPGDGDAKPEEKPETPGGGAGDVDDSKSSISQVSDLKAASQTSSVKLSWKKVSGAEGYYIYQYNASGKKWKKIAQTAADKTSFTVKKLKAGTGYRFGAKAYRVQGGKQILSDTYTSVYTATKPATVKFSVKAGKKKAVLKWNKVKGATGYTVYYKIGKKTAWKKLKSVKGSSYTAKKLKSGKTYSFTVKANKSYKGKTYTGSSQTKKVKVK